ncbi:MAG TPA: SEL1-like repeat protein [Nitrospira sp.]
MLNVRTIALVAFYVLMAGISENVLAEPQRPVNPKAAEQFASDSEKAERGDADAAYRLGEAFESGRFGGVVDLSKALTYYRQAAKQGHRQAAARVAEIEAKLGPKEEKLQPSLPSPGQGY